MTPKQKEIVRRSWAKVAPQADDVAAAFYERLFADEPAAGRLFGNKDMRIQGSLFVQMLTMFIGKLDDDAGALEAIRESGRRHIGYGVLNSDYDGVGRVLMSTLESALAADFTPTVRDAWAEAYRLLATTMRQAGASVI